MLWSPWYLSNKHDDAYKLMCQLIPFPTHCKVVLPYCNIVPTLLALSLSWYSKQGSRPASRSPNKNVRRQPLSTWANSSEEKHVLRFPVNFQIELYVGLLCPRWISNLQFWRPHSYRFSKRMAVRASVATETFKCTKKFGRRRSWAGPPLLHFR